MREMCVARVGFPTQEDDRPRVGRGAPRGRSVRVERFQARRGFERERLVGLAGEHQRAELGYERGISAEEETERLAHVGLHLAYVHAAADHFEQRARAHGTRHDVASG